LERTGATPAAQPERWAADAVHQVYVAADPLDAHLVRGFLESHGIEAIVRGETLFAVRGEVPMTAETLPTVWVVHEDAVARARDLINEYERSREPGSDNARLWRCPTCGEQHGPQFTNCWQCGATRPGYP
jgi:Putative prokaryotic signal transducing protein